MMMSSRSCKTGRKGYWRRLCSAEEVRQIRMHTGEDNDEQQKLIFRKERILEKMMMSSRSCKTGRKRYWRR